MTPPAKQQSTDRYSIDTSQLDLDRSWDGGTEHDRADDDGLARLRSSLLRLGRVVVAFSGGADSAFLAWTATDLLGAENVLCVTAVSPSLAPEELADCRALSAEWGLRHVEVETGELADPAYTVNDGSRCYHCKSSLMDALVPLIAGEAAGTSVVLGVNLDDLGDHRPGQDAAQEAGAVFPLVEAGMTKAEVRAWSHRLGLRTWDKPAAACLASRVPYGTPVSFGTLQSVAVAESGLRALGFRQVRVRHYGDTARIEVPIDELADIVARRDDVTDAVHAAGYRYVTLDLDGFRSGNLNAALEHRRDRHSDPMPGDDGSAAPTAVATVRSVSDADDGGVW